MLLLGGSPLRRGGLFVSGWLLTSAVAEIGLLTLGHELLLDTTHGSDHRTGLNLIGGGALIALGGRERIRGCWMTEQPLPGEAPCSVSPRCHFPCCC